MIPGALAPTGVGFIAGPPAEVAFSAEGANVISGVRSLFTGKPRVIGGLGHTAAEGTVITGR